MNPARNFLVLAAVMLSVIAAAQGDWNVVTVDSEGYVGRYASLKLDKYDNPHIAYFDDTNLDLKYAYRYNGSWNISTVDGFTSNAGMYCSIGIQEPLYPYTLGYPHISYLVHDVLQRSYLMYSHKVGSFWVATVVDDASSNYTGFYTSIAMDDQVRPRIAYYDSVNDDLRYAWLDSNGWHLEMVDSYGDVGQYASLALRNDAANSPRIAYYDNTRGDLKLATFNGTDWIMSRVDNIGNVGRYVSLALDSSGNPHMSYYDSTNGCLKYAFRNPRWTFTVIDSSEGCGLNSSIVMDGSDLPHIAYYDYYNQELKYAHFDGESWEITVVDGSLGESVHQVSIDLDSSGQPCIAYQDMSTWDLKYAYFEPEHRNGLCSSENGNLLLMVSPNPSSSNAVVSFTVSEATRVELGVYDVTGRMLNSTGGFFDAGTHEFPLEDMETGVYFVRMTASGFTRSERFLVIR